MQWLSEIQAGTEGGNPKWFNEYAKKLKVKNVDLLEEINTLSTLKLASLEKYLGGRLVDLPYETLETILINGSDDENVGALLREKREEYLKIHPEKSKGVSGSGQGIITFDGRFIPQSLWITASDSEKRGALVGSTCFHYNSDTPGMGSDPKDRF